MSHEVPAYERQPSYTRSGTYAEQAEPDITGVIRDPRLGIGAMGEDPDMLQSSISLATVAILQRGRSIFCSCPGTFKFTRDITEVQHGKGMLSDDHLMLDYLHGSGSALEELFSRYKHPLYAFFRRRLASKHRSEDLTQETFLAVIRNAKRYEPRALFRTYVYGIAMRLVTAERRKNGRIEKEMTDSISQAEDVSEPALWVRHALQRLPLDDREILMLREYEQLSYAEIATLLKIPVNTVRSRLFRSRLALKA